MIYDDRRLSLTEPLSTLETRCEVSTETAECELSQSSCRSGWRRAIRILLFFAVTILAVNTGLLVFGLSKHGWETGLATLYNGSCLAMHAQYPWAHLAINVCGTLLLAASNAAMQIVSAPTRAEVDQAHPEHPLEIGSMGLRNWRFLPWRRKAVWTLLALSSLPLQMLYNSVLFPTSSAFNYEAWVIGANFPADAEAFHDALNASSRLDVKLPPPLPLPLDAAGLKQASLVNLTVPDCIRTFNSTLVAGYPRLYVATNANVTGNTTISGPFEVDITDECSTCWMGMNFYVASTDPRAHRTCRCDWPKPDGPWLINASDTVRACYAEEAPEHCSIQLHLGLLITVIVCNIIKCACLISLLRLRNFEPLLMVGDGIASFMDRPEPETAECGPMSADYVKRTLQARYVPVHVLQPPRLKARRFFAGASRTIWFLTAHV